MIDRSGGGTTDAHLQQIVRMGASDPCPADARDTDDMETA